MYSIPHRMKVLSRISACGSDMFYNVYFFSQQDVQVHEMWLQKNNGGSDKPLPPSQAPEAYIDLIYM